MILYFSATGNSLAVARAIADRTHDALCDMGAATKSGSFEVTAHQGESLGIVFPANRWTTPPLVDAFVRKVRFMTDDGAPFRPGYCYTVETYAYFRGRESRYLAKVLEEVHGIDADASFAVKTVGNFLCAFHAMDENAIAKRLGQAEAAQDEVARRVADEDRDARVGAGLLGFLIGLATSRRHKGRSAGLYRVDAGACVGCGTCARTCPENVIELVDGHPAWTGADCTGCFACYHCCPQHAIGLGAFKKGTRYQNPVLKKAARG